MAVNIFIPEEKLQGSDNYNSWKARLTAILEENDLDDIVFNVNEEPTMSQQLMLADSLTRGSRVRLEGSSMILSKRRRFPTSQL